MAVMVVMVVVVVVRWWWCVGRWVGGRVGGWGVTVGRMRWCVCV